MQFVKLTILFLSIFFFGLANAFSQNSRISGKVADANNQEPVSGVTVLINGTAKGASTDRSGSFLLENVTPGSYVLIVRAIGFETRRIPVKLERDKDLEIEIEISSQPIAGEEVVITASRGIGKKQNEIPVSSTVITGQAIAESAANTTDEILRSVPGVQLPLFNSNVNFPVNPSVSVRGLGIGDGATRTLVLIDGTPANGTFFRNVFWNRIPKQNLDKIEVIRGANSSLFGSYAMGGVINLFTKPISLDPSAELELKYGSNDIFQAHIFGSTPISDRFKVSLAANYFSTNGYHLLRENDRTAIDRKFNVENFSLNTEAEANLSNSLFATIGFNYYNQDQERGTRLSDNRTEVLDVNTRLVKSFNNAGTVSFNFFYVNEDFETNNTSTVVRDDRSAEFISNVHDTPSDNAGGSLVWSYSPGSMFSNITVGSDISFISGEDDTDLFTNDGNFAFRRFGKGKQSNVGIFAETNIRPIEKLVLQASARVDFFRNFDGSLLEDQEFTNFENNTFTEFNPRISAIFNIIEPLSVRGSFFTGFRAPTLAELYRTFGTTTFVGEANPNLKQEELIGTEFGLVFQIRNVSLQANYFFNEIEDLVSGVVTAFSPFTLTNMNIGKAESQGLEFIGEFSPVRNWFINAGYTYLDTEVTENEEDDELIGNRIEGTPEHTVNAGVSYRPQSGLRFGLQLRYLDSQFHDINNEILLDSHVVVDANVSYIFNNMIEVFANGENIFDNRFVASGFGGVESLAAPIQVVGGIRVKLR